MQRTTRAHLMMWLTAMIWGFAFVAQRAGMEHVGPFTFSAIRFALGALVLLPLALRNRNEARLLFSKRLWIAGLIAGSVLFMGASAQQIGLVHTPAGKAGFITGLYVVFVPVFGILWKHRTGLFMWAGILLAVAGMYFLSIREGFRIDAGDMWVLAGAVFWANHVLVIAWLSPRHNSVHLAFSQFVVVSVLSLFAALYFEDIKVSGIHDALLPILYGGVLSVGIAYTLQVVAQKDAHPAYVSIVLSLETVFAALGGWWVLGETFTLRELSGCLLMLAGIFLAQLPEILGAKNMQARR